MTDIVWLFGRIVRWLLSLKGRHSTVDVIVEETTRDDLHWRIKRNNWQQLFAYKDAMNNNGNYKMNTKWITK